MSKNKSKIPSLMLYAETKMHYLLIDHYNLKEDAGKIFFECINLYKEWKRDFAG